MSHLCIPNCSNTVQARGTHRRLCCKDDKIIPNLMQLLDCLTKSDLNIEFASAELFGKSRCSVGSCLHLCMTALRCFECMGLYECAQRGCTLSKILPRINKDCQSVVCLSAYSRCISLHRSQRLTLFNLTFLLHLDYWIREREMGDRCLTWHFSNTFSHTV